MVEMQEIATIRAVGKPYLSVQEAAKYTGWSETVVRKSLRFVRHCRKPGLFGITILKEDIDKLINENLIAPSDGEKSNFRRRIATLRDERSIQNA